MQGTCEPEWKQKFTFDSMNKEEVPLKFIRTFTLRRIVLYFIVYVVCFHFCSHLLYFIVFYCIIFYCIILYCIISYCIILYCILYIDMHVVCKLYFFLVIHIDLSTHANTSRFKRSPKSEASMGQYHLSVCRLLISVLLFVLIHCIVLYCIVLYCIALYFIVLYCIVLYCILLYCIVLYCIVLYCIVLYCILFYLIVLY